MKRSSLTTTLFLAAFFLAVAVAPASAQLRGRLGNILGKAKDLEINTEQETAIGKEVAAKMITYFGLYENPKLADYVRKVGEAVAMQSQRDDIYYHFEILESPAVNAFAAPGGFIFVTRGLLESIGSEAELAGVLAHEVGHVDAKHVLRAMQRGKLMQSGLQEAGSLVPGSKFLDELAKQLLVKLIDQGLDPADEHDADQRGVVYAFDAGYRPDGLRSVLEVLKKIQSESEEKTNWLTRTHPPLDERMKRIEQLMAQRKMKAGEGAVLAERFLAARQP